MYPSVSTNRQECQRSVSLDSSSKDCPAGVSSIQQQILAVKNNFEAQSRCPKNTSVSCNDAETQHPVPFSACFKQVNNVDDNVHRIEQIIATAVNDYPKISRQNSTNISQHNAEKLQALAFKNYFSSVKKFGDVNRMAHLINEAIPSSLQTWAAKTAGDILVMDPAIKRVLQGEPCYDVIDDLQLYGNSGFELEMIVVNILGKKRILHGESCYKVAEDLGLSHKAKLCLDQLAINHIGKNRILINRESCRKVAYDLGISRDSQYELDEIAIYHLGKLRVLMRENYYTVATELGICTGKARELLYEMSLTLSHKK